MLIKEVTTLQPVARDIEREFIVAGIFGTSGGGSMGIVAGDGAVNGRLRMGRMGFGDFLTLPPLSSVCVTPWRVIVSFTTPRLGASGELRARPADRGRRGVISSNLFWVPWVVDGRLRFATAPKVNRESVRVVVAVDGRVSFRVVVAVDGRSSFFRLLPLLWDIMLVAVDGRCLIGAKEESADVEGRMIPAVCGGVALTTPELVVALRFLCSLV